MYFTVWTLEKQDTKLMEVHLNMILNIQDILENPFSK